MLDIQMHSGLNCAFERISHPERMDSALLASQVGVAGLSLGAFSTTTDLLRAVQFGFSVWERFSHLDGDIEYFKTQLLLQKDILATWQRDWYGFTVRGGASAERLRLLKVHDKTIQSTLRSVELEVSKLDPLTVLDRARGDATARERMKWAAGQKAAAESSLARVESLQRGLFLILPLQSPHSEASIMLSLLQDGNSASTRITNQLLAAGEALPLVNRTVGLLKLRQKLDDDLERRIQYFQNNLPAQSMHLPQILSGLSLEKGTAGTRSLGSSEGNSIIVEWKGYAVSYGKQAILLRGRNDNLARMLHATPKPEEMLTLHCEGYFDDIQNKRYGFVFVSPAGVGEEVVSLNQLLNKPPPEELPSLEQRYQLAYSLALALCILFAIEWLHKGIRSHNVLFVRKENDIRWARPYLCGFAYSRPDKPNELSEKLEHSERFNVYRHPLAQGMPREGYRKTFDIYSLGVILFEIAMWGTAFQFWRQDANEFRKDLTKPSNQKRIAHRMGVDYRDAMMKCLDGSFEGNESLASKAFFKEVVEVLRCHLPD
jgi:Protein tyrosine and serine/threonine kinase